MKLDLQINKTWIKQFQFVLVFLGVYVLLHSLYFLIPDDVLRDNVYYYGIVIASESIINIVAPGELVSGDSNKIISSKAVLEIVRGCDGSGTMFLLVAAIVAFSSKLKLKFIGLMSGLILLYLVNQIRIVGLYFVVAYHREWFLPVHTYFAPTLIIIISVVFFSWWASTAARQNHTASAQELNGS